MIEIPKLPLLNKLNRYFIEQLEDKSIERKLPAQWSYMHLFSSIQVSRLLAHKRSLDLNISTLCVALHDVATIVAGVRENHAVVGSEMVLDVLNTVYERNTDLEKIASDDVATIISAVKNHSLKDGETKSLYDEFTKDVDTFDRHLHGLKTDEEHAFRLQRVSDELNLSI